MKIQFAEEKSTVSIKNPIIQESMSKPIQEEKAPKNEEKNTLKIKIPNTNVLSELEFKMFDNAIELIYSSNYKRYKGSRSKGMLNALNTLKEMKDIIEKRLMHNLL